MRYCSLSLALTSMLFAANSAAQPTWFIADSAFPGLPRSIHVYRSAGTLNGRPHVAWYVEADLRDRSLRFETDTTFRRRLTPSGFHRKNGGPLVIVNGTFFSFTENKNLNAVMSHGRLLSFNVMSTPVKGDSLNRHLMTRSAIGIDARRRADVAWLYTDSARRRPVAFENAPLAGRRLSASDGISRSLLLETEQAAALQELGYLPAWRMRTAIGGGPVLVQSGQVRVTNDEERMFMGKARDDLHPRTAMGYTADGRLLILAVEGRNKGVAEGASLTEMAQILVGMGAVEALNLDGGGSSCLLIDGRETIKPSDKEGQRAVPAVFMIRQKKGRGH